MSKDKHTPKVSVIIPTYNRASYLKEAIESVLAQTYKDFELIIVDDGSTDNTEEVVRSFDDERIIYKKKQREGHPGKTRNVGLDLARGEYIAFLDDDDLWLPEKLEEQIKALEQYHFRVCYTIYSIFGKADKRDIHTPPKQIAKSGFLFLDLIKFGSFVATPTICIKKEVFEKVGKFAEVEELRSGQDYEMWLRIAEKFYFFCIPKPLVLVRFHTNTVSETFISKRHFAIYNRVVKNARVSKYLKRRFLSLCYFIEGEYKVTQLDEQYRYFFLKSLLLNPFALKRFLILPFLIMPVKTGKMLYLKLKHLQKKLSKS